jgi:hypothetical protein
MHEDWVPFASQVQLADTSLAREQLRSTLLQQALPQIPAAINNARDALLAQGVRLAGLIDTMVDGRLGRIEGTLNCWVQSQLRAAQLLAEQLAVVNPGAAAEQLSDQVSLLLVRLRIYTNFYFYLQASFPPPAAALQPSSTPPPAGPPAYTFINAHTVGDVWREYKEGIAGGPAVEQLEQRWQSRWRPAAAQRTAWSRRKTVLDEVQRLIDSGLSPADAVADLEARRGTSTLRSLIDALVDQKRQQGHRRQRQRQRARRR